MVHLPRLLQGFQRRRRRKNFNLLQIVQGFRASRRAKNFGERGVEVSDQLHVLEISRKSFREIWEIVSKSNVDAIALDADGEPFIEMGSIALKPKSPKGPPATIFEVSNEAFEEVHFKLYTTPCLHECFHGDEDGFAWIEGAKFALKQKP
jgi:hypothetical protein